MTAQIALKQFAVLGIALEGNMSFRKKVFLLLFAGIFTVLMVEPILESSQSTTYTLSFFILSTFTSLVMASLLSFILQKIIKSEFGHVREFVKNISQGEYHRRLSAAPCDAYVALVNPINNLTMHFEEQITSLMASNEELNTILDTMTEGVLVLTPSGSIQHCNKALQRMFPNTAKAQGWQVVEAIPVPRLQKAVDDILTAPVPATTANNGCDKITNSLQVELSVDRVFTVHLTRATHPTLQLGAVVVFHDVSAIFRLERVRRDFVANVSHELRTPLTAIQGYAETLANTEDFPEEYLRFVEIIRRNGAYLARMVEELLALARLENAHLPLQTALVHPQESVQAALALCRQQLDLRNILVRVDFPENFVVLANTQHLTQIFRNLIENAGRYAPENGEILITASSDTITGLSTFAIHDKGPGIPEEDCHRIFERFYRVEKHRSHGSTGLGLAICKHTVERLGGRIWVESPVQEYATVFYFTIPTSLGDNCDRATQISS